MYENYKWKFGLTAFFGALAIWGLYAAPLNLGLDLRGGAQLIYRLKVQERGWVGLSVRDAKEGDPIARGVYVTAVQDGSPAKQEGFGAGDVITQMDGIKVNSEANFQEFLERKKSGEVLNLTYISKAAYDPKDPEGAKKEVELIVATQKKSTRKLADNVIEVLKKRLDGFGLREMTIQKQGRTGIVIQVPGVNKTELAQIESVVGRSGKLSFKIVPNSADVNASERSTQIKRILRLKDEGRYREDSDKYDIALNESLFTDDKGELRDPKITGIDDVPLAQREQYYVLLKNPGVSGDYLADAYRTQGDSGAPAIGFTWGSFGGKKFYKMTSENIQQLMAVTLDGKIKQQATIQSAISNRGIITGKFSEKEIREVVVVLKGGALQAKPILQSKEQVGPSIGRASLTIGQYSILAATILVLAFMFMFYKGSGIIANVALVLNLVLILGILTIFEATLTLPGIAGILLTAGMAVDANILIFERIREELEKDAGLKQSIQAGYERAFWTIFDANLTTLLTAFILFKAGTGPIKGFAVTLMVGIMCSMFTALFVTRAIYGWMVSEEYLTEMKMARILDKTKFNFMGQRAKWGMISLVCINVGFLVFGLRGAEKYGIDFTGGSVVSIALKEPMSVKEVKEELSKTDHLKNVSVTMSGQTDKENRGYFFNLKTREVAETILLAVQRDTLALEESAAQAKFQSDVVDLFGKTNFKDFAPTLKPNELGPKLAPISTGSWEVEVSLNLKSAKKLEDVEKGIQKSKLLKGADVTVVQKGKADKNDKARRFRFTAGSLGDDFDKAAKRGSNEKITMEPEDILKEQIVKIFSAKGIQKSQIFENTECTVILKSAMKTRAEVESLLRVKGLTTMSILSPAAGSTAKSAKFTLKLSRVHQTMFQLSQNQSEDEKKVTAQDAFKGEVEKLFEDRLIENLLGSKRYEVIKGAVATKKRLKFKVLIQRPGDFSDYEFDPLEQEDKFVASVQSILSSVKISNKSDKLLAGTKDLKVSMSENDKDKPFVICEVTTGDLDANPAVYTKTFQKLNSALEDSNQFNTASNFMRVSTIGASIAYNLKSKAMISLFFSLIAIVLYITIRFEFRFGIAAIAALIHDVLFAIGFLAILDWLFSTMGVPFDAKINLPTVAAFLTIIGYSLNDTIVVFDRIRENMASRKMKGMKQEELINASINQTLSRTILTSVTTFFVVFVLFVASFFGLSSIQGLSVALLVGVVVGTYSSIFVACSTLLMKSDDLNKLFLYQGLAIVGMVILTSVVL